MFTMYMYFLRKKKKLLEKSTFLASKLGNGPLVEHGPLIEILPVFFFILMGARFLFWSGDGGLNLGQF